MEDGILLANEDGVRSTISKGKQIHSPSDLYILEIGVIS